MSDPMSDVSDAEMPRYRSHKQVWALKIAALQRHETGGGATITPAEPGYAPFDVDSTYMGKHDPRVGGYFVVYEGGYKSWSPAEAFEGGYTRV